MRSAERAPSVGREGLPSSLITRPSRTLAWTARGSGPAPVSRVAYETFVPGTMSSGGIRYGMSLSPLSGGPHAAAAAPAPATPTTLRN